MALKVRAVGARFAPRCSIQKNATARSGGDTMA